MSRPVVSVIIPCYRQGHFLAGAIQSALAQTYPAVEVVVVNDGSDDETDAVARGFGSQIQYVSQRNQGLSAARNAGIAVATGKYLLCLDADDLLAPDAVCWLVEAAEDRYDVLCMMGYREFASESGPVREVLPSQLRGLPLAIILDNLGPPHTFLSSREMVLRTGGFDPTLRSCEDWDQWLRLIFHGAQIVPVEHIGAYYRKHPASMSRNEGRMSESRAEVLLRTSRVKMAPRVVEYLGISSEEMPRRLRAHIARAYLDAGYHVREQGNSFRALRHYLRSVWYGVPTVEGIAGVCKLLPHRIRRAFRASR